MILFVDKKILINGTTKYTIPDTYDFITTSDLSDYLKISDADTTYLKKSEATTETWTFTLEDGTTKTKQVYIKA